jgi:hypothetical protein
VAAVSAATPQPAQATRLPAQRLQRPKVGMISLGCAKNLVDAEIMLGSVLERGMEKRINNAACTNAGTKD